MSDQNDKNAPEITGEIVPPPFEKTALAGLAEKIEPVKPLRSPFERAIILFIFAGGLSAVILSMVKLRSDLSEVSCLITYAPTILEMLAGWGAFILAMRWSVPGHGVSYSRTAVFWGVALGLALLAALAAPHLAPASHPGANVGVCATKGMPCLGFEMIIGVPMLMAALWLIHRGASAAPWLAGGLAGVGAGRVGAAGMHRKCIGVDPSHTLAWRLGAVAVLSLSGCLAGWFLPRR